MTLRIPSAATLPTRKQAPAQTDSGPAAIGTFRELRLVEPLLRAVQDERYDEPTPIQQQSIPALLEGRDLFGCARTGTGKTAAFVLPILQRLAADGVRAAPRSTRALILAPTRELAAQVQRSVATYGRHLKLTSAIVYGGVGQGPQVRSLARGVDVLVATPGRLLDLIGQQHVRLDRVEILVLDEADQMLDLGFLPDIRRILGMVPARRQTIFFSATLPPAIGALADKILVQPVRVFVTPPASTVEAVEQSVYHVEPTAKAALLGELLSQPAVERALVFTRTKRGADRVARDLARNGVHAQAIHGNKSQNNRERALEAFRNGRSPVLVATDIAARGLDIDDVTHVVNYELPNVPESYVHRIGRTARAGARGTAISFCSSAERSLLRDIERLIRREIPVAEGSARPAPRRSGPSGSPRPHPMHAHSDRPAQSGHAGRSGSMRPRPTHAGQSGEMRRGPTRHGSARPNSTRSTHSAPRNSPGPERRHHSDKSPKRPPHPESRAGRRSAAFGHSSSRPARSAAPDEAARSSFGVGLDS